MIEEALPVRRSEAAAPSPLTERILAPLGRPRWAWMLALGLVGPGLTYFASHLTGYIGHRQPEIVAFAFTNAFAVWVVARLGAQIVAVRAVLEEVSDPAAPDPFGPAWSAAGPLALVAVFGLVYPISDFVAAPGPLSAAMIPVRTLGAIPTMTGLWFYMTILVGLSRVGRTPLRLRPCHPDQCMGLQRFGSLGFEAFVMFAVAMVPQLAVALHDVRDAIVLLSIFAVGAALFFLSLYQLHRQLVAAKAEAVRSAQSLYAAGSMTLDRTSLREQALLLLGADSLERQWSAIHTWPFGQGVLRNMAAVTTGVIAAVVARLIINRLGI